jgi:flagellar protein FlgJ
MISAVPPRVAALRASTPATAAAPPGSPAERDAKLREATGQLEGMFVQQLFKAMRETVPQEEGIVSGGAGEDMFTGLMDQHLAAETPRQWGGGLSDALYRQLRGHTSPPPASAPAAAPSPALGSPTR